MNFDDYLALGAMSLLRQSPILLIGAIGLWFALPMRSDLRRAAIWASTGFGLLIIHALASVIRDVASVAVQINELREPTETGLALTLWALVAYLPLLAAIAFLARAFFMDRSDASRRTYEGSAVPGGTA